MLISAYKTKSACFWSSYGWLAVVRRRFLKENQADGPSGSSLFPETNAGVRHQGRGMLGPAGNSRSPSHLCSFPLPRECTSSASLRNYFTLSKQNIIIKKTTNKNHTLYDIITSLYSAVFGCLCTINTLPVQVPVDRLCLLPGLSWSNEWCDFIMLSAPLKKQDIFNSGAKDQAAESSSSTSGEDVIRLKSVTAPPQLHSGVVKGRYTPAATNTGETKKRNAPGITIHSPGCTFLRSTVPQTRTDASTEHVSGHLNMWNSDKHSLIRCNIRNAKWNEK